MSFITRVGQGWSGVATGTVVVPVTTATIGTGSLLVGIGWGTIATSVSSVTDTQGNTYVQDGTAATAAATRNAAIWRCANFKPLTVYDPLTGTGDQITVVLANSEDRGLSVIIDEFTGLGTPDVVAGFSTPGLVNTFKLNTATLGSDVITYTIVMPDFTVNWINPPTYPAAGSAAAATYLPTGLPVTPVGGSSLQAAYNTPTASRAGPVTIDWSWGPQAHNVAVLAISYPAAPNVADAAACEDDFSVVQTIAIPETDAGACLDGFSVYQGAIA